MKKFNIVLLVVFFFPVMICGYYLSALFSPDVKNTIYTMMDRYKIVKAAPFANYFSKYTVVILFFLILFYFVISIIVLFGQKTRRPGEEQGSSKWESPQRVSKLLSDRSKSQSEPMNIVVFIKKKPNIFVRFLRNIFYWFKSRKAD